ncbi:hypothetical protein [Pseudanabaena sp. PCC 6802]|uniref:hypothetical protein n=1 Tax=Pseudanabaena sp. PCC 6802 TaxID=118173 RepID=UPI000348F550|nr:hypothetical protein [Pseudanabaena sp. PCC 6802]
MTTKVKLTISLDEELDKKLRINAVMHRKNISDVVVAALSVYLACPDKGRNSKTNGGAA